MLHERKETASAAATTALSVRDAIETDAEAVRHLAESFGFIGAPAVASIEARIRQYIADKSYLLVVAELDGAPVGYAFAQDFGPGLRVDFSTGRLHDVFVLPTARRQGVGRALINAVSAWAHSRPCPLVLDWQAPANAVGFYESFSFKADRIGDLPQFPAFCIDTRKPAPLHIDVVTSAVGLNHGAFGINA